MNLCHQVRRLFALLGLLAPRSNTYYVFVAPSLSCFLLIDVGPDFGDNQACSQGDLPTCLLSLFAAAKHAMVLLVIPKWAGNKYRAVKPKMLPVNETGGQGSQTWKHLQLSSLGHHSPHYDERRRMARKYVLYIAHSAARVTMTRQSV